jgi:asparagine synthase (glutamine-hydrolysing)
VSAIFGIVNFHGRPAHAEDIKPLSNFLAPYAPAHESIWCNGEVALGCRILRTTPESVDELLPYFCRDSGLCITADARLDNRAELIAALGSEDKSRPDGRLILDAFIKWREDCASHLLGDFAFVIWDSRVKRLFCARSHMGARGFCYFSNDEFFAFATESAALLRLSQVPSLLDERIVADILVSQYAPDFKGQTCFKGINCLPAACQLQVDANGKQSQTRFWNLEPSESIRYASQQEAIEAFENVFDEVIDSVTRCERGPAVMLSGGVDSACMAGALSRHISVCPQESLKTYSAILDSPENCIESQSILELTKLDGFEARFVGVPSMDGGGGIEALKHNAWEKAHPTNNSLLLPVSMVQLAAADGQNVMLHAVSGDKTCWSEDYYLAPLMIQGRFPSAWREASKASSNHVYLRHLSAWAILYRNLRVALVPAQVEKFLFGLRRLARNNVQLDYLNPDFVKRLKISENIEAKCRREIEQRLKPGEHQRGFIAEIESIADGVLAYSHIGSRFGVEMRDPWSDVRVIKYFLSLGLQYKVSSGWTKYVARSAYSDSVPNWVRFRTGKEHLGYLFCQRLMQESGPLLDSILRNHRDIIEPLFDFKQLKQKVREFKSGDESHLVQLFDVATIVLWLRRLHDVKLS